MIEIRNVTKTYEINKEIKCTAINDVSLVLPDSGMVFIIGKSGSGKSTLLNLIGGLDCPTEGTIISEGNDISTFNQAMLTKYRSSYIGFIFQDYHVLKTFTVKQNINLALDIINSANEEKVDEILKVVDLTEYKDRYPHELSGGQKQRIAVARALVKDAPVILCDEPTGNLDSKTSKQILDLLKEISHTRLVVIVSHNMVEANNYADRIIELFDGKVIRDRRRSANYSNDFKIENNVIYIPHYRDLTSSELELINYEVQNNPDVAFKQIGNRFFDAKINAVQKEPYLIKGSLISRKTSKRLFKSFFKGKTRSILLSVFLAALLLTCFAIFQAFLSFDGNSELSKSLTKYDINSVPLQKSTESSESSSISKIAPVLDEDVESFYQMGYTGNIYKKYTNALPITTFSYSLEQKNNFNITNNVSNFYLKETLGVINCDDNFLASVYGAYNSDLKKNEIKYLALASEYKSYGIYITDYVADSILIYNNKRYTTYQDILGDYIHNNTKYGYINGIIDTGYKDKYKYLVSSFAEIFKNPDAMVSSSDLKDSEEFARFLVEVMNYLGYGYSLEANYIDNLKTADFRTFYKLNSFKIYLNDDKEYSSSILSIFDQTVGKMDLDHDEIVLSKTVIDSLFPSGDYNENEQFEIKLKLYSMTKKNNVLYEKTFKVVRINTQNTYINIDLNPELREYDVIPYGIYLDSHNQIGDMLINATERNFVICSADATKLSTINRVLDIFGKFFLFIEILFLLVSVIFIVNIGLSSVRKNKYEIGILKAIGTSSFDIIRIYIRQTLIVCLLMSIFTNVGILIGTHVSNSILVKAFEVVLDTKFYDLILINYIPKIVIADLVWTVVICFISFIIPQIMLFRIKPIDIIRARE